jgi:hypothetical protein
VDTGLGGRLVYTSAKCSPQRTLFGRSGSCLSPSAVPIAERPAEQVVALVAPLAVTRRRILLRPGEELSVDTQLEVSTRQSALVTGTAAVAVQVMTADTFGDPARRRVVEVLQASTLPRHRSRANRNHGFARTRPISPHRGWSPAPSTRSDVCDRERPGASVRRRGSANRRRHRRCHMDEPRLTYASPPARGRSGGDRSTAAPSLGEG